MNAFHGYKGFMELREFLEETSFRAAFLGLRNLLSWAGPSLGPAMAVYRLPTHSRQQEPQ